MSPKVSIIMATYNAAAYLEESLQTVAEQTFRDYEFLIIDDTSSDETVDCLKRFAASDSRIQWIQNERNQGVGANYRKFLELARGEFVAQMGQDDRWHPEFLQKTIDRLESDPQIVAAFTAVRVINGSGREIPSVSLFRPEQLNALTHVELAAQLLRSNFLCAAASLFRRSEVIGWDTVGANDQFQDWNTWQHLILRGGFAYLDSITCDYRIHGANLSLGARNPSQLRIELEHTRLQMIQCADFAHFVLTSDSPDRTFQSLLAPYLNSEDHRIETLSPLLFALTAHEGSLGMVPAYAELVGSLFWMLGAFQKGRRYFARAFLGDCVTPAWKYLISRCEWRYLILVANPRLIPAADPLIRTWRWGGVVLIKARVRRGSLPWLGFRLDRRTPSIDRILEMHLETKRQTLWQGWLRVWGALRRNKARIFIRYFRERVLANRA